MLKGAEEFATGDYTAFLTRGASMDGAERERILGQLADLIGLPVDLVTRAEGRITMRTFSRELLRDERKVVGLYDATITSTDPFPDRDSFEGPDPTLQGITPAYTMAINRQLRSEIGVETDREYTLISFEVNNAWKDDAPKHFFAPPVGATDDFRYGMALNPHMKAFVTHGRYDLVTPYYSSDRLRNLMRLDPAVADRLTVRHFGGGHMFYAWEGAGRRSRTRSRRSSRTRPGDLAEPAFRLRPFEEPGRHGHARRPPVDQVVHEDVQHRRPGEVEPERRRPVRLELHGREPPGPVPICSGPVSAYQNESDWAPRVNTRRWLVTTRSAAPNPCHLGIAARWASAFFWAL